VDDEPTLELWAAPRQVRRGRALAFFLLLNWVAMGWLVMAQGLRSLSGALAFAFGLLTLLAGLSQFRAIRLATRVPLVRLAGNRLESRFYTGAELRRLDLAEISRLENVSRDQLVLARRDGGEASVPCLALAEADRDRLETAVRARLARPPG
jgi:hypothetical protein